MDISFECEEDLDEKKCSINNSNELSKIMINAETTMIQQVNECICEITNNKDKTGNGFLCQIPFPDQFNLLPVLISSSHFLIPEQIRNTTLILDFGFPNPKKHVFINNFRKLYSSQKYDITIIEIIPEIDGLYNYLDLDDESLFEDNLEDIYKDKEIYIVKDISERKKKFVTGKIGKIEEFNIAHSCQVENENYGGPIINLETFCVIGVIREKEFSDNKDDVLLKYPCQEFIRQNSNISIKNKIIIKLDIDDDDVDEEVYFFDNSNYKDKNGVSHCHENLGELTVYNTKLFINDNEAKYQKYIIPKPEETGTIIIRIEFEFNLINCCRMFYECDNIVDIDMSNCDTQYVTDMSFMFYGCNNLTKLNLCSMNTISVKDTRAMFSGCNKLTNLYFSPYFNNKNNTSMEQMFFNCENLTELKLEYFHTENVNNMSGMCNGCKNMSSIDLSSFDTGNVTDMSFMFNNCNLVENLNLLSFETKKVKDMRAMFSRCKNLRKLEISDKFNTEEVTSMEQMFADCNKLTISNINFNTYKVINMSWMFYGCFKITNLDLSNFEFLDNCKIDKVFYGCFHLKKLKVRKEYNELFQNKISKSISIIN